MQTKTHQHRALVFLKNFTQDKIEPPYTGPYRISGIAKSQSQVFIERDNKILRAAVSHIFYLKEEEDVECQMPLHGEHLD